MVFGESHLQKILPGIFLFNEQKYWECHEALEDVWAEDNHDPVRYVYWAVIQVAAACIHYRDQNLIGAQGMIAKAKEKFKKCHELHILSPLVFTELDWKELEDIAMKIPDSKSSTLDDFADIFKFRFKKHAQE